MTGYVRVDTSNNIADGNVISAADLDNEFDGIQAAFNASTGHNHDGTTGEGAPILVLGPTQDVVVGSSTVTPKTTNTVDIGSSSLKFKDLFLAGNASIGGTLAVTGVATLTANPVMSGGTANGVAYLNGSKVLTTGSALVFDGTSLGIGTSSPANRLHVNSGTLNNVALFESTDATALSVYKDDTTTLDIGVGATADNLVFVNSVERMRIDSSGNLGIGTTSPTNRLSVTGNANVTGNVTLGDATTDTVTVNGYMGVGSAATSNVGIYVTSSALATSSQYGVFLTPTSTSAATTTTTSLYVKASTAAAAYTSAAVRSIHIADATKGAGSTITDQQGLYIADQTQGTNNYGITSLVSSGTNKWNIYASGTAANYFNGSVGIGTTTVSEKLTVSGGVLIFGTASTINYNGLVLDYNSGTGEARMAVGGQSGASSFLTFTTTLGGTEAERMRLDASGNLGLGVTPSAWSSSVDALELPTGAFYSFASGSVSNFYTLTNAYLNSAGNPIYKQTAPATQYLTTAGQHQWFNAPSGTAGAAITFTQAMTLDADGDLGIGTTSPLGRLDVAGTAPTLNIRDTQSKVAWAAGETVGTLDFYSNDTSGVGAQAVSRIRSVADTASAATSGALAFWTAAAGAAATEKVRITSAGSMGIGTTSPSATLDVVGETLVQGRLQVTAASPELLLTVPAGGLDSRIYNDGGGNLIFGNGSNSVTPTERMRIDASGNVQVSTGAIVVDAPAPASISTTATLTNANIQAQIISTTGTSYTVTMPLGTTMETLVPWATTDLGYDFTVINTASGIITMAVNTGVTSLGSLIIAIGASAQFRIRRTAANTFILYRLS